MTEGLALQSCLLPSILETTFLNNVCSVMKRTQNVKYNNDYVHMLHAQIGRKQKKDQYF